MKDSYINISKAFSSSLVERIGTSTILNSFVSIKQIAEAKGLKSTHSLRLEINKPESKYISREVKVNGGVSYEILFSSLEPELQQKLRVAENKSTELVPLNYKSEILVTDKAKLTRNHRMNKSKLPEYTYYCKNCDEDFYSIEQENGGIFRWFDYINHSKKSDMIYIGQKAVINVATRFYHEHFNQEDDYDENWEVKTFQQALEFWECNGCEIR